jgi:DNA-binding IclR family transcriptional regulator
MLPVPIRRKQGVNAVERALAVLDAFIGDGSRGLADLAKATGLVKPTILRLLVSLEAAGCVVRLADGRYQLGAKVMQLGTAYASNFRLDQHVLPVLRALADRTRESAAFHIREKDHRLRLFRVESPQSVRDFQKPAVLAPLDATSTGRVLALATWPDAKVWPTRVYATSGVYDPLTSSVSTAVFGASRELVGALTVSGPIGRFGRADLKMIAGDLAEAARRLSIVLGAPLPCASAPAQIIRTSGRPDAGAQDQYADRVSVIKE